MLKIVEKNVDKGILNEVLNVQDLSFINEEVYKVKYKGEEFYSFPFFCDKGLIHTHKLFNFNFDSKLLDKTKTSYWLLKNPLFVYYDYLIISDNPTNIIKYISKNFHHFEKTSFVCIVPSIFNNEALKFIKKKYAAEQTISVFSNSSIKEILKIKLTFSFNDKVIQIKKLIDTYTFSYNNHTIETKNIKYAFIRNRFKIKLNNIITHK